MDDTCISGIEPTSLTLGKTKYELKIEAIS